MAKRKRSKSPKRKQAETEAVCLLSPAAVRQCYMFTLSDDVLYNILFWTRPDDEDQSIWLWLCRISATCRAFRRLVRLEKKGVTCLMPTVFELERSLCNYYDQDLSNLSPRNYRRSPVSLRLKLMDTIRKSDWMGSKVTCIRVLFCSAFYKDTARTNRTIAKVLKNLLTAPCLPNLLDLEIRVPRFGFSLIDEGFLHGLARVHSGLRSLFLMNAGYNPTQDEISPNAFAALSASMTSLREVGIGVYPGETFDEEGLVLPDQQFVAFLANLNPNVTLLELRFFRTVGPGDEAFTNLSLSCPNLKSLKISSKDIKTLCIAQIIRSKPNIISIDLTNCVSSSTDEGVIDAIVETKLRLESFRVPYCDWFNDGGLMRLLENQIGAFNGRALLSMLEITDAAVSPAGLRAFLKKWRETNPVLPMTIQLYFKTVFGEYEDYDGEGRRRTQEWRRLIDEFPDVNFTK